MCEKTGNVQCSLCHNEELDSNYKLLCDTIFWTNLHLTEQYITINTRRLFIDVDLVTPIVPPPTLDL